MYPAELTRPMAAELTSKGFTELKSVQEVDDFFKNQKGVALLVINSVCGCAAGAARPGAVHSLNNDKVPNDLVTVFAGVDSEAVKQARKYTLPFPPSSPSMAVFKDGELVHFLERHNIEGVPANLIAENLKAAYNEFC